MKNLAFGLVFFGLTSPSFAQDVLYLAKVEEDKVPASVVSSVKNDFKGYSVTDYIAVPVTIVDGKVTVMTCLPDDHRDYDSYEVGLEGKGKTLEATYDSDGTLISTYANLKNTALPSAVAEAIEKKYPNSKFEGDRFIATHYTKDGKTEQHYHVKIDQNGEIHHVYLDSNGKILRG